MKLAEKQSNRGTEISDTVFGVNLYGARVEERMSERDGPNSSLQSRTILRLILVRGDYSFWYLTVQTVYFNNFINTKLFYSIDSKQKLMKMWISWGDVLCWQTTWIVKRREAIRLSTQLSVRIKEAEFQAEALLSVEHFWYFNARNELSFSHKTYIIIAHAISHNTIHRVMHVSGYNFSVEFFCKY